MNQILKKSFSIPELAWKAAFKKNKVKIDLLTVIDMLSIVGKGIRGGICHSVIWYTKSNNKFMKDYDKNKESSYLRYWDGNNLYGWEMLQKRSVNNFELMEDISQFNGNFIKSYKKESDEGNFMKLMFHILKNYRIFIIIYHFSLRG